MNTQRHDGRGLEALPDGSRIWVFSSARPFTPSERERLDATFGKVFDKWGVKQPGMRGCHRFVEDRFVLVGADEGREMLDGCSVDAMMSWVRRVEQESGLRLMDRLTVHYRDEDDGGLRSVSREQFAAAAAVGRVTLDTPVFDTTLHCVEAWRAGRFEVPARASWHARLLGA